jgi:hypothetical protein
VQTKFGKSYDSISKNADVAKVSHYAFKERVFKNVSGEEVTPYLFIYHHICLKKGC